MTLTGRELDRACAVAMGWTFVKFPDGPCPDVSHWTSPSGHSGPLNGPYFSTDPGTLDEKLAWLIPKSGSLYKQVHMVACDDDCVTSASILFRGATIETAGSTIHEAVALLVVEVAKALGEAPKETTS